MAAWEELGEGRGGVYTERIFRSLERNALSASALDGLPLPPPGLWARSLHRAACSFLAALRNARTCTSSAEPPPSNATCNSLQPQDRVGAWIGVVCSPTPLLREEGQIGASERGKCTRGWKRGGEKAWSLKRENLNDGIR